MKLYLTLLLITVNAYVLNFPLEQQIDVDDQVISASTLLNNLYQSNQSYIENSPVLFTYLVKLQFADIINPDISLFTYEEQAKFYGFEQALLKVNYLQQGYGIEGSALNDPDDNLATYVNELFDDYHGRIVDVFKTARRNNEQLGQIIFYLRNKTIITNQVGQTVYFPKPPTDLPPVCTSNEDYSRYGTLISNYRDRLSNLALEKILSFGYKRCHANVQTATDRYTSNSDWVLSVACFLYKKYCPGVGQGGYYNTFC